MLLWRLTAIWQTSSWLEIPIVGVATLGPGIWVGDGRGLNFARPRDWMVLDSTCIDHPFVSTIWTSQISVILEVPFGRWLRWCTPPPSCWCHPRIDGSVTENLQVPHEIWRSKPWFPIKFAWKKIKTRLTLPSYLGLYIYINIKTEIKPTHNIIYIYLGTL